MCLGVRPWVSIPMSQKRDGEQETLFVTSGTRQEDTKLNEINQSLRVLSYDCRKNGGHHVDGGETVGMSVKRQSLAREERAPWTAACDHS